jgi:hypothetical protein
MTNLLSKTVWVCQSAGAEILLAKMWIAPDSSPTASRHLKEPSAVVSEEGVKSEPASRPGPQDRMRPQ